MKDPGKDDTALVSETCKLEARTDNETEEHTLTSLAGDQTPIERDLLVDEVFITAGTIFLEERDETRNPIAHSGVTPLEALRVQSNMFRNIPMTTKQDGSRQAFTRSVLGEDIGRSETFSIPRAKTFFEASESYAPTKYHYSTPSHELLNVHSHSNILNLTSISTTRGSVATDEVLEVM